MNRNFNGYKSHLCKMILEHQWLSHEWTQGRIVFTIKQVFDKEIPTFYMLGYWSFLHAPELIGLNHLRIADANLGDIYIFRRITPYHEQ